MPLISFSALSIKTAHFSLLLLLKLILLIYVLDESLYFICFFFNYYKAAILSNLIPPCVSVCPLSPDAACLYPLLFPGQIKVLLINSLAMLTLLSPLTSVFNLDKSFPLTFYRFDFWFFQVILNIMFGPFGFNFPHFLMNASKSINFPLITALATSHRF